MISEKFIYLGLLLNLIGGVIYARDAFLGRIKPNRVSWGLWALAVMIAFSAQIKEGVGLRAWVTFMVGLTPILIFLTSFANKKAYWKLTKFDIFCGLFSLVGLALWQITKNGNLAILFSIFADLAAGTPTLIKAYKYPETENWIEFGSSFVSVSILILTLNNFSFAFLAFPFYIFCFDLAAVAFIKFRISRFRFSN